jgi:glycosyltransferase involved in cell wall biosynthesis
MEADGRIQSHVIYMEMAAPDTYWGQSSLPESAQVLGGGWWNIGGGRVHWNPGVLGAVKRSRPELVVIVGYSSLTSQLAMASLRWNRTPWVFWGEIPGMRDLRGWGKRLRKLAQYPALNWPCAIAAIGTRAVDEYRRLAHRGCEVVNIPYHTDLKPFLDTARTGSGEAVRILYCGQLIERKGIATLIDAFVTFADDFPELELLLVGEGPQRQSLAARVPTRLQSRVVFAGFQGVERLPHLFSTADLFVLPSLHDGWGVVVNQALGAGLPIICSSSVGAAADLVSPGWNGLIVPPADVSALAVAIRSLVSNRQMRLLWGEHSRSAAYDWVPSRGVDRWVDLAERVLTPGTVDTVGADGR